MRFSGSERRSSLTFERVVGEERLFIFSVFGRFFTFKVAFPGVLWYN